MYPTDLTDSRWEVIKSLLNDQRKRKYSLREIFNGIFYINKSGCQWRMLPKEYPPYSLCFYYYRKWTKDGTWKKLNTRLVRLLRTKSKRKSSPSVGIIDSQSIKNSERGVIDKGFDGNKWIQGRKRHIVTDTLGNILSAIVHPANYHDSKGAYPVLKELKKMNFKRLHTILADQAYRGKLVKWAKEQLEWNLKVVHSETSDEGFKTLPTRWIVERTISWLMWSRRLSKDFEAELDSAESQVYIANLYRCLSKI